MSQCARTKCLRYIEVPANITTPPSCRLVCLESLRMSCDPAWFIPVLLRDATGMFCVQTHSYSTILPFPTFNECSKDNVPLFFFRRTEQRDRPENHRAKKLLEYFSQRMFKRHNTFYGDVLIFWRRSVDEANHEMKLADFTLSEFNRFLGFPLPSDTKQPSIVPSLFGISPAPVAPPPIDFHSAGTAKRKDVVPLGGVRIGSAVPRPKPYAWNLETPTMKPMDAMNRIFDSSKISKEKFCDNELNVVRQSHRPESTKQHSNPYGVRNAELYTSRRASNAEVQDCPLGFASPSIQQGYESEENRSTNSIQSLGSSEATPDSCDAGTSASFDFRRKRMSSDMSRNALPNLGLPSHRGLPHSHPAHSDDYPHTIALHTLRTFLSTLHTGLTTAWTALDTISCQEVLGLHKLIQRQCAQISTLWKEIKTEKDTNKRQLEELKKLRLSNADLTRDFEQLKNEIFASEQQFKIFFDAQNFSPRRPLPHLENNACAKVVVGVGCDGYEAFCHQPPPGRWICEEAKNIDLTPYDTASCHSGDNGLKRVASNNNGEIHLDGSISTSSETNNEKEEEEETSDDLTPQYNFRVVQEYNREGDDSHLFMNGQFGDEVTVEIKDPSGWWWAVNKRNQHRGWYPSSYFDAAQLDEKREESRINATLKCEV